MIAKLGGLIAVILPISAVVARLVAIEGRFDNTPISLAAAETPAMGTLNRQTSLTGRITNARGAMQSPGGRILA